jgi:hypothetical protein
MQTPEKPGKPQNYGTPMQEDSNEKPLDRISNFKKIDGFLNSLSKDEICSLGKVFKNPKRFGKSQEEQVGKKAKVVKPSQAFRIEIDPSFGMAAKIMENTLRNRREIDWYYYFMEKYPNVPNFPLVSKYELCDVCSVTKTYNQRDWTKEVVEQGDCIVLFSELADGDLQSVYRKMNEDEIASMVSQVLMVLLIFEQEEIIHYDLNFGNLLFHNQTVELSYLDGHITIPSQGKVWTIWDLEFMSTNEDPNPLDSELKIKVKNTFEVDWKKFLTSLEKHFPNSDFVQKVREFTESSESIAEVINKF